MTLEFSNIEESVKSLKMKLEYRMKGKADDCYSFDYKVIDYIELEGKEIPKSIAIILGIKNRGEFERIVYNYLGKVDDIVHYNPVEKEYSDLAMKVIYVMP